MAFFSFFPSSIDLTLSRKFPTVEEMEASERASEWVSQAMPCRPLLARNCIRSRTKLLPSIYWSTAWLDISTTSKNMKAQFGQTKLDVCCWKIELTIRSWNLAAKCENAKAKKSHPLRCSTPRSCSRSLALRPISCTYYMLAVLVWAK